jgi:hypothetical protein
LASVEVTRPPTRHGWRQRLSTLAEEKSSVLRNSIGGWSCSAQSWIASSLRFQRKRFAFVAGNDGAPRVCPVLPQPRHCERSEAIQLFCSRRKSGLLSWAGVALRKAGLLRRFAPRNDGAVVTLRRHCERSEAIQLLRRVRPTLKRSAYSLYLWLLTFTSEHFRQRKSVPRSGSLEFPAASRAVELEKKSVPPRE